MVISNKLKLNKQLKQYKLYCKPKIQKYDEIKKNTKFLQKNSWQFVVSATVVAVAILGASQFRELLPE